MKKNLAKLIDLKSLITLALIGALIVGWFKGLVVSEQFIPIVMMVATFYFAKTNTPYKEEEEDEQ